MLQRFRMGTILTLFILGITLMVAPAAFAQSTTDGAIDGSVFDQNNSLIPQATVLVHNEGTNAEVTATSDDSGYFRVIHLSPATYLVTISAPGFAQFKAEHTVVAVGLTTSLLPHLNVGSAGQTVTVTGEAPLLNAESPDFASNLSLKTIDSLPINGRRWSNFALLTPGVVADSNGFGLLSFRGISPILNNVEVDGADNNQAFFSEERGRTRAGYSTSQASIQEFQVNTGVYSTEYGRAAGGVVNSITKSGSNALHGMLFFYDRDNNWGSKNPFTQLTTYAPTTGTTTTSYYKPKDWRKQWGFGVGGAIVKDRLFWFYTYDQLKRNFPGTAKAASPGAFFAPPSASTISTLAKRLTLTTLQATSLYNQDLADLAQDLGPVKRTGDQVINTPKIDWQVNSKNRASFLFHRLRWDSPGGVQTQASNSYAIDSFGTDYVKLDFGIAKLVTLFNPVTSNEVRYQYGRELNDEGAQPTSSYTKNHLINGTGIAPGIALATSTGFFLGTPYYSFRTSYPDERKWQVADTVNWIHSNHTLKFGTDIVHNHDLQNNLYQGNGQYNYGSLVNYFADLAKPNGTCDSNAASSTVGTLPCYSSVTQGIGPAVFQIDTTDLGFFVQDTWKVMPRLTFNVGVRYDYEKVPPPFKNLIVGALPEAANHPSDKNNLGPRVGFAYDLFGTGKTVVRGGYGLYYGRLTNGYILNTYENTGTAASQNNYTFYGTTSGHPTLPGIASVAPSLTPNIQYFDKNFQLPQVHQFDLTVQRDLGAQTVLSVSYLGALSRQLPNYVNLNLDPKKRFADTVTVTADPTANGRCGPLTCGKTITTQVYSSSQTAYGVKGSTSTLIHPQYNAVTKVVSNVNASYNALVAEVQNRTFRWVQFDANYTFSHALDFNQNQSTSPSSNGWYDPFATDQYPVNHGNSNFNVPNRFVGWALFTPPSAATDWKKYLLNEWSLNPIFAYQNGLPYSYSISGSAPNLNSTPTTAGYNRFASGPIGTGVGFLPDLGRNTLQQPHTAVVDLRAQKQLTFAEKYKLQLIGEAFNLMNHQNITGVNSTSYSFNGSSLVWGYNGNVFGQHSNANSNYSYSTRQIQVSVRLEF